MGGKENLSKNFFGEVVGVFFAILLVVWACAVMRITHFIDDAFITFRCSYNLAHAGKLLFNIGTNVEAETNLLWAILVAPLTLLPWHIENSVLYLSVLLIGWMAARLYLVGRLMRLSPFLVLAGVVIVVCNPQFIRVATDGLEVPLFSALLAELIFRYLRQELRLALFSAGLLFATRPEAAMFGIVVLGIEWLKQRRPRKSLISATLIFLSIVATICAYRIIQFHNVIPNSVVAKSLSLSDITRLAPASTGYVLSFILANIQYVLITVIGIILVPVVWRREPTKVSVAIICLVPILASYLIVYRNSGDWMPNYRLFLQYAVLYISLFYWILAVWFDEGKIYRGYAFSILTSLIVLSSALKFSGAVPTFEEEPALNYYGDAVERINRAGDPASDVISAEAVGEISYRMIHYKFHDPVGLADAYLARHGSPSPTFGRENIDYTLGVVKPSVLFWHWAGHLRGANASLINNYNIYCLSKCGDDWSMHLVMIRKDRAMQLGKTFNQLPKVKVDKGNISLVDKIATPS